MLGSAYPGLDDDGWIKLTRNWALFFVVMAALNEAVWRNSSTDFWVGFKLWGAIPLTFLFAAANVPMLMRHGLDARRCRAGRAGTGRMSDPILSIRGLRKSLCQRHRGAEERSTSTSSAARFSRCSAPTARARRR